MPCDLCLGDGCLRCFPDERPDLDEMCDDFEEFLDQEDDDEEV